MFKKWEFKKKDKIPIIATSIHCGHRIPFWVKNKLHIREDEQLREEDPFTDIFTEICSNRVVVHLSRFAVDMNRPLEGSVYSKPEQSWGIKVWNEEPEDKIISRLHKMYNNFYKDLDIYLENMKKRYNNMVILDIHSYNHMRNGEYSEPDEPIKNPDINIGTGTMITDKWRPLIDRFIDNLRKGSGDMKLDVRENIKFKGGYFPTYIHKKYTDSICVISIEFKKIFMNEWTGEPNNTMIDKLKNLLRDSVPDMLIELKKIVD